MTRPSVLMALDSRWPNALDENLVSVILLGMSLKSISGIVWQVNAIRESTQERKSRESERLGSINQVGQIEIRYVVADDDIRINLGVNEIHEGQTHIQQTSRINRLHFINMSPSCSQQISLAALLLKIINMDRTHMATNDVGAGLECKYIANKRLGLALYFDLN